MTTKQQRLKEVYDHLRAHYSIHTQIDFAEAINITRPALSSAMNGNEAYLTKNLFQKICGAFPGVFDLNYLLTGKGDLLTIEEEAKNEEFKKLLAPALDPSSIINALIANHTHQVNRLEEDIKKKEIEMQERLAEKDDIIAQLQQTVEDKITIIKAREAQIVALERQLAANSMSDISHYPFTIGAAEDENKPHVSP